MKSEWNYVEFPEPFSWEILAEVDSTSDELWRRAESHDIVGQILVAEVQTHGRGRRGSAWISPDGALAVSIGLPALGKESWRGLLAGVLVARVLEKFDFQPRLKWPNDVWLSGKKVAGLLLETRGDTAVLGIGLNVAASEFPPDWQATSLSMERELCPTRIEILTELIREISRAWSTGTGDETIREFRARCGLTGHWISWLERGESRTGECFGVSESGALVVITDCGREELWHGEQIRLLI